MTRQTKFLSLFDGFQHANNSLIRDLNFIGSDRSSRSHYLHLSDSNLQAISQKKVSSQSAVGQQSVRNPSAVSRQTLSLQEDLKRTL